MLTRPVGFGVADQFLQRVDRYRARHHQQLGVPPSMAMGVKS
jgi:hypothetical protein